MSVRPDSDVIFLADMDYSRLDDSLKKATNSIENESKKWSDAGNAATDQIMDAFDGLFKKLVAGFSAVKVGQAIFEFGKEAVNAATELKNAQKAIDSTFGQSGAMEQWAGQAADNFGLAEAKAKDTAASIGSLLRASDITGDQLVEMSTTLTGLSSDIAEFYGTDF